jgi:light-regulated signal transduction histidine kinase (bacteriophytochrome)
LLTDKLIAGVAGNENLLSDPEWLHIMISEVIEYDGIVVYRAGELMRLKSTPSDEEIMVLVQHLNLTSPNRVFTTDHLTLLSELDAADPDKAAGVLAIPISRTPRDYILLFRREWQQSIKWGGEPGKFSASEDGLRLSPRKSFAAFSEIIRGKSRPFSDSDRRIGEAMRSAMIEVILRLSAVSMAALAAEVEARRLVERAVFGLNEQFETKVQEQTRDLIAANSRLTKKIAVGVAALKSSRADVGSGRVDLLASETALASAQLKHNARLIELVASERALATARAETELGAADLQASETALASSQAETRVGVADLRTSIQALAASRAETELGVAELHASETALASSQAEIRLSAADLLLSVTDLATSRAETKVGVADLLASTLALAASRAEMKISLADLLIGAVDLAASQAETKAGESQLLDSEDANRVLAKANEVLVINEVALERLVAQRTAALRAEINTRRIMATAIAHELNQPLTAVSSYLSGTALLAERGDMTPETLAMIAKGSRQAARNAIRAGDILKLLRNSITRDDTALTDEDIGTIISEAIAVAVVDGDGLGIKFSFDHSAKGMNVMVNRTQIRQVMANLIQNAAEAVTGTARREVRVTVNQDTATGLLTIDVADTGPGISPEQLAGLFMPFVSNKPHGMGIGLSISREIVEQHHGKLTTRANPGGGAIFSLVLPRRGALAGATGILQ